MTKIDTPFKDRCYKNGSKEPSDPVNTSTALGGAESSFSDVKPVFLIEVDPAGPGADAWGRPDIK